MREGAAVAASPTGVRIVLALGIPLVAAMAVVGTYLGQEIVMFAGLLSLSVIGFLFIRPMIGLALMTSGYMVAAYPSALQALGILSVINLVGLCLLLLLLAQVLEERHLASVLTPPVLILVGIGVVFLFSTLYADIQFPMLEMSRATGRTGYRVIDRTGIMTDEFVTRLAFLVFLCAFIRDRTDIRVIYFSIMFALFVAVPSALSNWLTGDLARGFRVTADVTAGGNANRLGMICGFQIIFWWHWCQMRPSAVRKLVMLACVSACILVISGTGSRSALVGTAATFLALQIGPRGSRVPLRVSLLGAGIFATVLLTVAPPAAVERMFSFFPETRDVVGASSIELREMTVETGKLIIRDHPILGVGLGNFREVARQVYSDKFFRPPHNSVLWAAAEGGVVVLLGYAFLFWHTWRNYGRAVALGRFDPQMAVIGVAGQRILVVFLCYSLFADLWLSPLLYVQVGLAFALRRYMEGTWQPTVMRPIETRAMRVAA